MTHEEALQALIRNRDFLEVCFKNQSCDAEPSWGAINEVLQAYQVLKPAHVDMACGACRVRAVIDAKLVLDHQLKFRTFE